MFEGITAFKMSLPLPRLTGSKHNDKAIRFL